MFFVCNTSKNNKNLLSVVEFEWLDALINPTSTYDDESQSFLRSYIANLLKMLFVRDRLGLGYTFHFGRVECNSNNR